MSVTMEELLSRLEQWNPPDQVEFVTSAIAQMSAGQQREIKQFLDSLLQRDFISLLYTRSYQNIAEEILSFLDADSLAAAESVCSIWRDVILQGRLWQRLIQYRAKQDCMWRQVLFRLDLVRYFHWSSYDPVWLEYQNEMVSVAETVGVGSFHSPICKKSDSAISSSSVDYKQEHSSVYRCLYFHLAQLTNRIRTNWNEGRYSIRRLQCRSDGIRGVYCVQYDPYKIVCGLRDNTIKIYDKQTLDCKLVLTGHTGSVLCLQFDDRMILSASSDTTVRSWSIATGESLCTLRHHREGVLHLRFMADTLVTCSRDNTVAVLRIISPSDIRFLCSLTGHKASVNVVDFDSKYILSGGGDRTIRVWSMTTLTLASTLVGHRRGVDCLHYHGQLAVSGSSDLTVRIWDVESSQCLRILEGHKELVRCLRFNETHIVSGAYDGTMKIWDLRAALDLNTPQDNLCVATLREHSSRVFRLQFDTLQIVSSSHDNSVLIWDFFVGTDDLVENISDLVKLGLPQKPASSIGISSASSLSAMEQCLTQRLLSRSYSSSAGDQIGSNCDAQYQLRLGWL